MSDEPLSDLVVREESLAKTRDALATLQQIPGAGLDEVKYETVTEMVAAERGRTDAR